MLTSSNDCIGAEMIAIPRSEVYLMCTTYSTVVYCAQRTVVHRAQLYGSWSLSFVEDIL